MSYPYQWEVLCVYMNSKTITPGSEYVPAPTIFSGQDIHQMTLSMLQEKDFPESGIR